jgi:hypothetical protein
MSGEDVIMESPEDSESEVIGFRNIDTIFVSEKTIGGDGPMWLWC